MNYFNENFLKRYIYEWTAFTIKLKKIIDILNSYKNCNAKNK